MFCTLISGFGINFLALEHIGNILELLSYKQIAALVANLARGDVRKMSHSR